MQKEKRTFREKFNLTEEEMRALVFAAQDGDEEAKLRLLDVFSNFLIRYHKLLYHNKYSFNDYDIRRFIGLFIKDPFLRRAMMSQKMNKKQIAEVAKTVKGFTYMVRRYGDEEDVEQTVNSAFLHCVKIWKPKGTVPFSAFLYAYYFYILQKLVKLMLIDQTGRHRFPMIDPEDMEIDPDAPPAQMGGVFLPSNRSAEEEMMHFEIDEYWVIGDNVSFPFSELSQYERQIIKWRYIDRERISQIAKRTAEHPNTVRDHFAKVRTKLREMLQTQEDLFKEWDDEGD